MLISQAFAQDAAAVAAPAGAAGALAQFLPLVLIFVIFYFLLIRPQQKKMREHQTMLGGLQKGDKVISAGGIYATVVKVEEGDEATLEISEGVKVRVQKSTIGTVIK